MKYFITLFPEICRQNLGVRAVRLKNQDMSVLDSLSSEQITAIGALENGDSKTPEEVNNALSKVPGLTDEQIQSLVDLEMSLLQSSETLNSDGNKKE